MKKNSLLAAATALLMIGGSFVATTAGASPGARAAHAAKAGSAAPSVATSAKRGKRGPKGRTGPAGPKGPTGPQGPPGVSSATGNFNTFNKLVPLNGSETVTIGQFTVSEVATASGCSDLKLIDNSAFNARVALIGGFQANHTGGVGIFHPLASAASFDIGNLAAGMLGDLNSFSAALVNGSSTITGTLGGQTISGAGCLTTGTITGS